MTPEQKLKHAILLRQVAYGGLVLGDPVTAENIDALFESSNEDYELQDATCAIRSGVIQTELPTPMSRHYEAKEVAAQMPDGSWVGWTYWYGGGKHGEPESIDWMDQAYDLEMAEETKTVVVRTFTKKFHA